MPIPILKGLARDRKVAADPPPPPPSDPPTSSLRKSWHAGSYKSSSRSSSPGMTVIPRGPKTNPDKQRNAGIVRGTKQGYNPNSITTHLIPPSNHNYNNSNYNTNYNSNTTNTNYSTNNTNYNANTPSKEMVERWRNFNQREISSKENKNRSSTCSNSSNSSTSTLSSMSTTSSEGPPAVRQRMAAPDNRSNANIRARSTEPNSAPSYNQPTRLTGLKQPTIQSNGRPPGNKDVKSRIGSPKPVPKMSLSDNNKYSNTLQPPKKITTESKKNITDKKSSLLKGPTKNITTSSKISYLKKSDTSKPKENNSTTRPLENTSIIPNPSSRLAKPTAAVKGTTKILDKTKSPLMSPEVNKRNLPTIYTPKSPLIDSSSHLQKRILATKDDTNSNVSVALVSPMPTRPVRPLSRQNSTDDNLEVLKPILQTVSDITSELKEIEMKSLPNLEVSKPPNKIMVDSYDGEDPDLESVSPMQPLQGTMHYNYMKGLSQLLTRSNPPVTATEYNNDESNTNTIPSRSSRTIQTKRYSQPPNIPVDYFSQNANPSLSVNSIPPDTNYETRTSNPPSNNGGDYQNITNKSDSRPPSRNKQNSKLLNDHKSESTLSYNSNFDKKYSKNISEAKYRKLRPQPSEESPKINKRIINSDTNEVLRNATRMETSLTAEQPSFGSLTYNPNRVKSHSINGVAAEELSRNLKETILNSKLQSPDGKSRIKSVDESLDSLSIDKVGLSRYPFSTSYSWLSRNRSDQENYNTSSIRSISNTNIGNEGSQQDLKTGGNEALCLDQFDADTFNLTSSSLLSAPFLRSSSVRGCRSDFLYKRGTLSSARSEDLYSRDDSVGGGVSSRLSVPPASFTRGSSSYSTVIPRTFKDDQGSTFGLGSSGSLGSTTSGGSSPEQCSPTELIKLRRDLADAQSKVHALTTQLETNAQLMSAFEQSLGNMTNRLHQLTASSQQKECELQEVKKALEHVTCKGGCDHKHCHVLSSIKITSCSSLPHADGRDRTLPDVRRHTFNGAYSSLADMEALAGRLWRGPSSESICSLSSTCSAASVCSAASNLSSASSYSTCSAASGAEDSEFRRAKKKGWLRNSFSKAFSRKKQKQMKGLQCDHQCTGTECVHKTRHGGDSCNPYPLPPPSPSPSQRTCHSTTDRTESSIDGKEKDVDVAVKQLKNELEEKDAALTEVRLEALTSAHQLDSLKHTISKLHAEMMVLKTDKPDETSNNNSLEGNIVSNISKDIVTDIEELKNIVDSNDSSVKEKKLDSLEDVFSKEVKSEGKCIDIVVLVGCHGDYDKFINSSSTDSLMKDGMIIGQITVCGKTKWCHLDEIINKTFRNHIKTIDPEDSLGLTEDSILSYHVGEITRSSDLPLPELLPCGYIIGHVNNIKIILKGSSKNCLDSLSFQTLIPKSNLSRYCSLLTDQRRIILCGPAKAGKSYLAQKLAEYLVTRLGVEPTSKSITTFSIDAKNGIDLKNLFDSPQLPLVIILEQLQNLDQVSDVFSNLLSSEVNQSPMIIGTTNQNISQSITDLQLQFNFRCVLLSRVTEPCNGIPRRLARRLLANQKEENQRADVLDWLPSFFSKAAKIVNSTDFSDVPLGVNIVTSCPLDRNESGSWFADIWTTSLGRHLAEAVCSNPQDYNMMRSWEDLTSWMEETYPWKSKESTLPISLQLYKLGTPISSNSNSVTNV